MGEPCYKQHYASGMFSDMTGYRMRDYNSQSVMAISTVSVVHPNWQNEEDPES